MKFLFIGLSFLILTGATPAKKYVITFTGLAKKTGTIYVGWYNNAADFPESGKAVIKQVIAVKGVDSQPVIFSNISPGTYAIAVFFDRNGNGKMDTNVLGIPKEKYGFSNNVFPLTRAASFKEAAFTVQEGDGAQSIRLK